MASLGLDLGKSESEELEVESEELEMEREELSGKRGNRKGQTGDAWILALASTV